MLKAMCLQGLYKQTDKTISAGEHRHPWQLMLFTAVDGAEHADEQSSRPRRIALTPDPATDHRSTVCKYRELEEQVSAIAV